MILQSLHAHASFPYDPLYMFKSSNGDSTTIYSLDPPSSISQQGQLRSFNPLRSTVDSTRVPYETVSSGLSFLQKDPSIAYTASIDGNGTINVFAGKCSSGASASSLWQFDPDKDSWSQRTLNAEDADPASSKLTTNYLAPSISFSSTLQSPASIYTFGGMCPTQSQTESSDWTSAATYSNQLVVLHPDSDSDYDFQLGTGRSQPIAEAGFTITPLQPSFSNNSDGTQSQTQNFLLLGGHTQEAFINMSQVAVFSLPQASWTFLPINPTAQNPGPGGQPRQRQVEPRSGHTALLTDDGSKVVLFGGWVGDVTSASDPQLAILDVGMGYGGSQQWAWTTAPAASWPLASSSDGIYGHGAIMLPGDVMMISGGFKIPKAASPSKRHTRRALSPDSNTQDFFYNVTAGQWMSSYDPKQVPASALPSGDSNPPGVLSTKPQKVGLGVGLTLGLLAVGFAALLAWILSRRFREQRQKRDLGAYEKHGSGSGSDLRHTPASRHHVDPWGMSSHSTSPDSPVNVSSAWGNNGRSKRPSDRGHWEEANDGGPAGMWNSAGVREAERTGVDLNVPSPHRGLRKGVQGRNIRHDIERRWSHGSVAIHPMIEENDEEALIGVGDGGNREISNHIAGGVFEDPFKDPDPIDRHMLKTPPLSAQAMHSAASPERIYPTRSYTHRSAASGRLSPEKDARTNSNLSERSTASTARFMSVDSPSGPTYGRTPPRGLSIVPNTSPSPHSGSPTKLGDSPTRPGQTPTSAHTNADSFLTARSNLGHEPMECSTLLPSNTPTLLHMFRGYESRTAVVGGEREDPEPDFEPTFTRRADSMKAPTSKVSSWVGSVRRVINHASGPRSSSLTNSSIRPGWLGTHGGDRGGLVYHESAVNSSSGGSSPTKSGSSEPGQGFRPRPPRRTASEDFKLSGTRDRRDWGFDDADPNLRTMSLGTGGGSSEWVGGSGVLKDSGMSERGDWDVEAAARERNVQVMFSVPKERLRVVNPDLRNVSGGSGGSGEVGEK